LPFIFAANTGFVQADYFCFSRSIVLPWEQGHLLSSQLFVFVEVFVFVVGLEPYVMKVVRLTNEDLKNL